MATTLIWMIVVSIHFMGLIILVEELKKNEK